MIHLLRKLLGAHDALTPAQTEARKGGIGGSDAAAICGKDPYRTAYEVALRLTGQIEPDYSLEDADQIMFGNEMEGVLARIYEKKHKVELFTPDTIKHPKHPFLICHVDRRIKGNPKIGIECKNTGLYVKAASEQETWGAPGTDEVPLRVILQCQHAMMIDPQIEFFHVLRCFGGNQFQQYTTPRNAELIEALLTIELTFMENVKRGILPEPDWFHKSTSDAFRRQWQKIEGTVQAMPELVHWTKCWEEADASAKEALALRDSLKNRITAQMGNVEVALLPDGRKWRRKLVERAGYTVEPAKYIENRIIKPRGKKDDD